VEAQKDIGLKTKLDHLGLAMQRPNPAFAYPLRTLDKGRTLAFEAMNFIVTQERIDLEACGLPKNIRLRQSRLRAVWQSLRLQVCDRR
jgi:RNase H-fold protein (predicted Holliday junction resolvase)